MELFLYLLKQVYTSYSRILSGEHRGPRIVFASFIMIMGGVVAAEFFGFLRAFRYLMAQPFFGPSLTLFVMEQFSLLMIAVAFIGALLSGFFIYFYARDTRFFTVSPIPLRTLFTLRFMQVITLSLWPFVLMGVPLLAAFGMAHGLSFAYYARAGAALGAIMIVTCGVATCGNLIVGRLVERWGNGIFLILTALVGIMGYVLLRVIIPESSVLVSLFSADNMTAAVAKIEYVAELFRFIPSHWFVMVAAGDGIGIGGGHVFLSELVLVMIGILVIVYALAEVWYRRLVFFWHERIYTVRATSSHQPAKSRGNGSPFYFQGTTSLLFERDVRLLLRNGNEVARILFILGLLLLYLFAILFAGKRIGGVLPDIASVVLSLHLVAVSYFAGALALRLVFPSISLEGRSAWVLWSAPIKRNALIRAKGIFFSVLVYMLTETLLLITSSRVGMPVLDSVYASILLLFLVLATASFGLLFGTWFADFHEDNPDRLATSLGGMLMLGSTLLFGVGMGACYYAIRTSLLGIEPLIWLLIAGVVSGGIICGSVRSAERYIVRMEVS